jgi:hypothetical protein
MEVMAMANETDDPIANIMGTKPYGTTGGATPDSRSGFLVWDFDPTTQEYLLGDGKMRGWDGSTSVVVHGACMFSSATSGSARIGVAFRRCDDEGEDADTSHSWSYQEVTIDAPSTNGQWQYWAITFTSAQIDGITEGDGFEFCVTRITDHGDDDAAGDMEFDPTKFEILAA